MSRDTFEAQLNSIELLLAMYSGEGELTMRPDSAEVLGSARDYINDSPDGSRDELKCRTVNLRLRIPIEGPTVPADESCLILKISFSLAGLTSAPRVTLERPVWLEHRAYLKLCSNFPVDNDDIVSEIVEYLKEQAPLLFDAQAKVPVEQFDVACPSKAIVRVWFYFPSLSTRQKRNDLVQLAPVYGLTGFVLAGKPGVLCLEGLAPDVQSYIADIKRNSWGDIPSFQKKITERFREHDLHERKFHEMKEITDEIERHGQRGNRGDLSQVEQFLKDADLAEAFSKVFMQREGQKP